MKRDWVVFYHYRTKENYLRECAVLIKNATVSEVPEIFYGKFPKRVMDDWRPINTFIREDGEVLEKNIGDSFEIELEKS